MRILTSKNWLNLMTPHYQTLMVRVSWENLMPRFYFHLRSKENNIPDDSGKELDTLIDAYEHARVLIDKILVHVGHDAADLWSSYLKR
jgi:hypothetical protein